MEIPFCINKGMERFMNYSKKILEEYEITADKRVSAVCRIMIGFMLLVALLNFTGIFKIAPVPLYLAVALSVINFFLPTVIYDILKIHHKWIRYFILFLLVLQSGLQYSVLSYHVILMLVFPQVISCLYCQKKYVLFTAVLQVPMVIISHVVAYMLKVVPDEPLITVKGTFLYGVVPRLIEMAAFVVICYYIAIIIQNLINSLLIKNQELYADQETILTSLSEIIESQSEHTGSHVKRVAEYTEILCRGLGYSEEEIWKISQASKMHDVGKIIVPLDILEKPGKLTAEEFAVIKQHTVHGEKMLESAPGELLQMAKIIAYEHHEKWDGTGYHGLKGEEIHPFARCVALADVFDALASKRPYKEPWPVEKIYEEVLSQKGRQFAPEVVDVFVEHFDEFKLVNISNLEDD